MNSSKNLEAFLLRIIYDAKQNASIEFRQMEYKQVGNSKHRVTEPNTRLHLNITSYKIQKQPIIKLTTENTRKAVHKTQKEKKKKH